MAQKHPTASRAKRILTTVLCLVLLLAPFGILGASAFALPPVYHDTFVGELGEKYDRLCSIDEPKIVVVGGSSVAFGLDSKMLEEATGMPVVNFGLYADLGTKLMMDLSRANINRGDIIILAPEPNAQTLSLYFQASTTLQAMDGRADMLAHVDGENYLSLIGGLWDFGVSKLQYHLTGGRPENVGAYRKENFNEWGDNVYDRSYNQMSIIEKSIALDFRVDEDEATSDYEAFIDYVNDYIAFANSRGATVYYSFCPMDRAALVETLDEDGLFAYYDNLYDALDCEIISDIRQYVMDDGYFYDTVFHLNNAGVVVRTTHLINDLARTLGRPGMLRSTASLPPPLSHSTHKNVPGNAENLYFELRRVVSEWDESDVYWEIVGLNEEGKKQTKIDIPNQIEHLPVSVIAKNAFADSALEHLTLGENITAIAERAFADAQALVRIDVPNGIQPIDITVPNFGNEETMTTGARTDLKIYVDARYFDAFCGDYSWDTYNSHLMPRN